MTHEEWIGQIAQAVHAANQGNPQELHRLASLLAAQEGQAQEAPKDPPPLDDTAGTQESFGTPGWQTPRGDDAPEAEGR